MYVCTRAFLVCVCACVRKRMREGERERERGRDRVWEESGERKDGSASLVCILYIFNETLYRHTCTYKNALLHEGDLFLQVWFTC